MHLLFGNPTSTLAILAQQEFSSIDAGSNQKYIQHKQQYLTQHHLDSRLAHLQETWDPTLAKQLDRDFQRTSSSGAKSVHRQPHEPYVTKLAKLRKEKNAQHRTGIDHSSSIAHQVRDGNNFLLPATIPECQQRCHDAQQEISKLGKDSVTLQIEDQAQLRREAIQPGDHETAKAIKYHIVAEQTKRMYQKLRYIRGIQKTGISRLDVPQDPANFNYEQCTEWLTIDPSQEIESKLRERTSITLGKCSARSQQFLPSLNGSTGAPPPIHLSLS